VKEPRLRYSGLINYFATLISFITGLAFTLIVTRKLLVEEFGLWVLITSIVNIFYYPVACVNYWAIRGIAREVPKAFGTAFFFSVSYSSFVTPLFLLVVTSFVKGANSILIGLISLAVVTMAFIKY